MYNRSSRRSFRLFLLIFCFGAVLFSFGMRAEAREVRIAVNFQYDDAREFSEGLAAVRSGDLWGYIDRTGQVAVPFTWNVPDVGPFSEGMAFTGRHFTTVRGEAAFDGRTFEGASAFSEGLAAVQTGGQWGFIDSGGQFVLPPSFEGAGGFSQGLAPVKKNGLWGFVDKMGRMLIEPRFLRAAPFSEGLAAVDLGGKIGYADRSGRLIVTPRYDEGGPFRNGLAPVRGPFSQNDWGYIDARGNEAIPRVFHRAGRFENGLAPVATDARCGYTDVRGRMAVEALYDDARPFSEGLAAVERDGKWGYIQEK